MGKSVLFVCYGNTCRSPMAQACLAELLDKEGDLSNWRVDSAGTSRAHIGSEPNKMGQLVMKKQNIYHHVEQHRARQVTDEDFKTFDYFLTMDRNNLSNLEAMAPKEPTRAQVSLLASYDDDTSSNGVIQDPYGGNEADYEEVFKQCWRSVKNFLQTIQSTK